MLGSEAPSVDHKRQIVQSAQINHFGQGKIPEPGVGNDGLTNEGSTATGLHVGGDVALAKDGGEIVLGDVINLFDTSSAEVDAAERVGLAINNGGNGIDKLVDSQGTGDGLNAGKGLGDAELVVL